MYVNTVYYRLTEYWPGCLLDRIIIISDCQNQRLSYSTVDKINSLKWLLWTM